MYYQDAPSHVRVYRRLVRGGVVEMYDDYRGAGPGSVLFAFLLGGAVGAILGLLFAPKTGKETRDMLAEKSQDYLDQGKDLYGTGVEKATHLYETGKSSASDKSEELKEKFDTAKTRVKEGADKATTTAKAKISDVSKTAKSKVGKVGDSVKAGVDAAESKAKDTLDTVADKVATEGDA
jgi:gas vesicle protein